LVADVVPMRHETPSPMFGSRTRSKRQHDDRVIAACPAEERTPGLQKA
jgi:hypothetical protein